MKVGDRVRWTSQSQGYTSEKRGAVVVVVPPRTHPRRVWERLDPDQYNHRRLVASASYSLPRNHESYLVAVPNASGRGRERLYWPVVSQLQDDTEAP